MPKKHLFYTRTHNRCRTPQMEGVESLSASCGGQSVAQGWHDDREGARGFTPARSAVAPFNPGEKTRRRHPRGSAWSSQPPNRHNGDHATPALKLSGERMDLRQSFRFAGQTEGRRNSSGDVRRRQSTIPERGSVCKTVGHGPGPVWPRYKDLPFAAQTAWVSWRDAPHRLPFLHSAWI